MNCHRLLFVMLTCIMLIRFIEEASGLFTSSQKERSFNLGLPALPSLLFEPIAKISEAIAVIGLKIASLVVIILICVKLFNKRKSIGSEQGKDEIAQDPDYAAMWSAYAGLTNGQNSNYDHDQLQFYSDSNEEIDWNDETERKSPPPVPIPSKYRHIRPKPYQEIQADLPKQYTEPIRPQNFKIKKYPRLPPPERYKAEEFAYLTNAIVIKPRSRHRLRPSPPREVQNKMPTGFRNEEVPRPRPRPMPKIRANLTVAKTFRLSSRPLKRLPPRRPPVRRPRPPKYRKPVRTQPNPDQKVPVQKVPVQKIPVQKIPVQKIPVQKIPVQKIPVQKIPVQKIPVQKIPVPKISVQSIPVQPKPDYTRKRIKVNGQSQTGLKPAPNTATKKHVTAYAQIKPSQSHIPPVQLEPVSNPPLTEPGKPNVNPDQLFQEASQYERFQSQTLTLQESQPTSPEIEIQPRPPAPNSMSIMESDNSKNLPITDLESNPFVPNKYHPDPQPDHVESHLLEGHGEIDLSKGHVDSDYTEGQVEADLTEGNVEEHPDQPIFYEDDEKTNESVATGKEMVAPPVQYTNEEDEEYELPPERTYNFDEAQFMDHQYEEEETRSSRSKRSFDQPESLVGTISICSKKLICEIGADFKDTTTNKNFVNEVFRLFDYTNLKNKLMFIRPTSVVYERAFEAGTQDGTKKCTELFDGCIADMDKLKEGIMAF